MLRCNLRYECLPCVTMTLMFIPCRIAFLACLAHKTRFNKTGGKGLTLQVLKGEKNTHHKTFRP